jgi:hypothetical protein
MHKFQETPEDLRKYLEEMIDAASATMSKMTDTNAKSRFSALSNFFSWHGVQLIVEVEEANLASKLIDLFDNYISNGKTDLDWYNHVKKISAKRIADTELEIVSTSTSLSRNICERAQIGFWLKVFGATHND